LAQGGSEFVKAPAFSRDALRGAADRLPLGGLADSRAAAIEVLSRQGLPTTRDEDWKYTSLNDVIARSSKWLDHGHAPSVSSALRDEIGRVESLLDADWLVIANGMVDADSLASWSRPEVQVRLLSETGISADPALSLAQLNAALLHDGLSLCISGDGAQQKPIGLLIIDEPSAAGEMSQARVEFEVTANSRARIVEYHCSLGAETHFANAVMRLAIGDGASVDYVRMQDRHREHAQTGRLDVCLGRDSTLNHCGFDLGGALVRNDLNIDIAQAGAAAHFNGLYLAGSNQHIDNHTRVDHRVGPAQSSQEYRGIANADGRCIWNGKAVVHEGADGTDGAQANHNLLLSADAEVDAKPELEIYAEDVKCSHGTTVGQLDEASLYYLRTRGLDRNTARQILTRAFAQTIVDRSPIAETRDIIAASIDERLSHLLHGEPA
jgi:Fe-S cluster assembly protein SufD